MKVDDWWRRWCMRISKNIRIRLLLVVDKWKYSTNGIAIRMWTGSILISSFCHFKLRLIKRNEFQQLGHLRCWYAFSRLNRCFNCICLVFVGITLFQRTDQTTEGVRIHLQLESMINKSVKVNPTTQFMKALYWIYHCALFVAVLCQIFPFKCSYVRD